MSSPTGEDILVLYWLYWRSSGRPSVRSNSEEFWGDFDSILCHRLICGLTWSLEGCSQQVMIIICVLRWLVSCCQVLINHPTSLWPTRDVHYFCPFPPLQWPRLHCGDTYWPVVKVFQCVLWASSCCPMGKQEIVTWHSHVGPNCTELHAANRHLRRCHW